MSHLNTVHRCLSIAPLSPLSCVQLLSCTSSFLDRIDQIASPEYVPSDQDILHCRKRTMDIQKIEFKMKISRRYGGGELSFWYVKMTMITMTRCLMVIFINRLYLQRDVSRCVRSLSLSLFLSLNRMFDVGGQRGERRKWIQVFDGISAVLFLVESSGFNCLIREDSRTNRLRESLNVFTEVWNSRFLVDSGFILFLNKQDVLREKINQGCRLDDYFPEFVDYDCSPSDCSASTSQVQLDSYSKARSFIRDLFLDVTKSKRRIQRMSTTLTFDEENDFNDKLNSRRCYWHYTVATDTENIKLVFEDIHTMILLQNLRAISVT